MQTLWNRAAQLRCACRCPQCLHSATHGPATRRATVSASKRVPKYLTSSTLWYSGIFAAAASIDAGAKVKRTEQWDRAIAEAKHELDEVEEVISKQTRQTDELGFGSSLSTDGKSRSQRELWSFDGDALDVQTELHSHLTSSVAHPVTSITHREDAVWEHRVPPQSIYASAYRKARHDQTRYGPKKLETIELAMDLLQLKAFANIQERGWSIRAAAAVPAEYAKYLIMDNSRLRDLYNSKVSDIKRLRQVPGLEMSNFERSQSDRPLCEYSQDIEGEHLDTTTELNRCIQELFRLRLEGVLHAAELTAKVYYNLSVSSAPPNIDTFNALLLGFSRARQPEQVRDIISAINISRMRPNEVTLATILRFFTATGDSANFTQWFALIRGWYGGLDLARPDVVVNRAGADRLIDHRNGARTGKVCQLPAPTPMVFGAIIRGILKFDGFSAALQLCEIMGEEGWRLGISGLAPLLKDCATRKDLDAGRAVWQQIQKRRAAKLRLRASGERTPVIHIDTYASMLRLCSRCNEQDLFAQVLDQAKNEHGITYADLTKLVKNALNDPPVFNYADGVEPNKYTEPGIYDDDLADVATMNYDNSIGAEPPPATSGRHQKGKRAQENIRDAAPQIHPRRPVNAHSERIHLKPITSAEFTTLVTTPLPQPSDSQFTVDYSGICLFPDEVIPLEDPPSAFEESEPYIKEALARQDSAPELLTKLDPSAKAKEPNAETPAGTDLSEPSTPSNSSVGDPPAPRFTIRKAYGEEIFTRPPSFLGSYYDDRRQHYGRLREQC